MTTTFKVTDNRTNETKTVIARTYRGALVSAFGVGQEAPLAQSATGARIYGSLQVIVGERQCSYTVTKV